mmetsp:Transcript_64633/g.124627  ORF Transcript_64633/g.124627 Transcript_64633/m.124627 type:complete len:211 (+) Transcript_64633:101-733(+)
MCVAEGGCRAVFELEQLRPLNGKPQSSRSPRGFDSPPGMLFTEQFHIGFPSIVSVDRRVGAPPHWVFAGGLWFAEGTTPGCCCCCRNLAGGGVDPPDRNIGSCGPTPPGSIMGEGGVCLAKALPSRTPLGSSITCPGGACRVTTAAGCCPVGPISCCCCWGVKVMWVCCGGPNMCASCIGAVGLIGCGTVMARGSAGNAGTVAIWPTWEV